MASASVVGAQTLQTLCSFNSTNGSNPYAALTLGSDGNFYGTAAATIFQVTTNGTLTTLVSFDSTNGTPKTALTLGSDGNFYGTTEFGGNGYGTVYKVTTNGVLTTVVSFNSTNGARPEAALTLGSDGSFYGTTYNGGSNDAGTVFKVTTNGVLTTVISFNYTNGAYPKTALTLGSDGNFYGTTDRGGSNPYPGYGTIFRVTTNGTLTMLVSFNYGNGYTSALTLGSDGNFYGTTWGSVFNDGTVYKVTTNGTLTTLVSFNYPNGANPSVALTLGSDGNFYGTTGQGGSNPYPGYGTLYKVTTNGTLTTLVSFSSTNGWYPYGALTLGTDGDLYGTTYGGGSSDVGTVFRLLLPPVIVVQPQSRTNNSGATATFLVSATSLNPVVYQWQKNGTNLVDGGNLSGTATNTLTITGISDSDAAIYSVIVSNANFGVISSNAVLTVNNLPFIATQPQSQTVGVGSNVTFTATAYGAPPFIFQWYYGNAAVGSPTSGTNVSSYTLTNVQTNQSGNYSVLVINGYGSLPSSNATLTVVALPPTITTQPANRTNNANTTATFSVVASSSGPMSYQWQQNGTNLVNGEKFSGASTNTLTITSVSSNEAAIYTVTVTNLAGSVTTSNALLTVIYPPVITEQPSGQRVLLGSSVSFNISVSGTAPFRYQWRFKSVNILNATNGDYAIPAIGTNDIGNYSVVVTNWAGTVTSSNALLTVLIPPALTLQLWAGYPLLNLYGMVSNNFVVQYNTNLTETNWLNLLSLTNLPASPYQFLDPAGGGQPARFYRAFME